MAAEPMPASLEKQPRATPLLMACAMLATTLPATPPPTALTEKAMRNISTMAAGTAVIWQQMTTSAPTK